MNNPLKYIDPTGYQTAAAPGAVSWLGGGGGWGESGGWGNVGPHWSHYMPNVFSDPVWGYRYDWDTKTYYAEHYYGNDEVVPFKEVKQNYIQPNAHNRYVGSAAAEQYKIIVQRLRSNHLVQQANLYAFFSQLNKLLAEASGYGMMDDGGDLTNEWNTRPDADGVLTFGEANGWYKWGKGEPLYVDLDKLDFSSVTMKRFDSPEFYIEGHPGIYVRFESKDYVNRTQALVYGTIGIVKIGYNTIMAMPDTYNFDLKLQKGTFIRDFATILGHYYAGYGTPFPIYFRGTTTLSQ